MIQHGVEEPDNDKAPSNLAILGRYILTLDFYRLENAPKKEAKRK